MTFSSTFINLYIGGSMRISIFNLSDKSNYKVEYNKMIKVLNSKCITYKTKHYTYFEFINKFLFNNTKIQKAIVNGGFLYYITINSDI